MDQHKEKVLKGMDDNKTKRLNSAELPKKNQKSKIPRLIKNLNSKTHQSKEIIEKSMEDTDSSVSSKSSRQHDSESTPNPFFTNFHSKKKFWPDLRKIKKSQKKRKHLSDKNEAVRLTRSQVKMLLETASKSGTRSGLAFDNLDNPSMSSSSEATSQLCPISDLMSCRFKSSAKKSLKRRCKNHFYTMEEMVAKYQKTGPYEEISSDDESSQVCSTPPVDENLLIEPAVNALDILCRNDNQDLNITDIVELKDIGIFETDSDDDMVLGPKLNNETTPRKQTDLNEELNTNIPTKKMMFVAPMDSKGDQRRDKSLREHPAKRQLFQILPKTPKKNQKGKAELEKKNNKVDETKDNDDKKSVPSAKCKQKKHHIEVIEEGDEVIDIEEQLGRLVFANLAGLQWWPGLIVKGSMCNLYTEDIGCSWIYWFGDHKVSLVTHERIIPFLANFNDKCHGKGKMFQKALIESIHIFGSRCGLKMDSLSDDYLLAWAKRGFKFKPHDQRTKAETACDIPETVNFHLKMIGDDVLKKVANKSVPKSKGAKQQKPDTRENAIEAVKEGKCSIQDVCIGCSDLNAELVDQHPLFKGGVCGNCKMPKLKKKSADVKKKEKKEYMFRCRSTSTPEVENTIHTGPYRSDIGQSMDGNEDNHTGSYRSDIGPSMDGNEDIHTGSYRSDIGPSMDGDENIHTGSYRSDIGPSMDGNEDIHTGSYRSDIGPSMDGDEDIHTGSYRSDIGSSVSVEDDNHTGFYRSDINPIVDSNEKKEIKTLKASRSTYTTNAIVAEHVAHSSLSTNDNVEINNDSEVVKPSVTESNVNAASATIENHLVHNLVGSENLTLSQLDKYFDFQKKQNLLKRKTAHAVNAGRNEYWKYYKQLKRKDSQYKANEIQRESELRKMKRLDPGYQESEKMRETSNRKVKRLDPGYQESEKMRETSNRKVKRLDPGYQESEKMRETSNRKVKRLDPGYQESEKMRETSNRKVKRLDPGYQESEKMRETSNRKVKRLDPDYGSRDKEKHSNFLKRKRQDPEYRESEKMKETSGRKVKRLDPAYQESEKMRETSNRKVKRLDPGYQESEKMRETSNRKVKRLDPGYQESEKMRETSNRKVKRLDLGYQESEKMRETSNRKVKRLDPEYQESEKMRETPNRKIKRLDPDYGSRDKQKHTDFLKKKRLVPEYRESEKLKERKLKKLKRLKSVNRISQNRKAAISKRKKRVKLKSLDTDELIRLFHQKVSNGPTYTCESCHQLWYKHSVKRSTAVSKLNDSAINCLTEDGTGWICGTCEKYIKKDSIPPLSIYNGNAFPQLPEALKLFPLEWRLLSPRIPFMKVYAAPSGGQKKIRGNVVNVVANVCSTISSLPRAPDENFTIAAKLKRQLKYNHAVMTENIRPYKIREAVAWLEANGDLFHKEGVHFNEAIIPNNADNEHMVKHIDRNDESNEISPEVNVVNAIHAENSVETNVLSEGEKMSRERDVTVNDSPGKEATTLGKPEDGNVDDWSEDEGEQARGSKDTMLTSPDFIEDDEKEKVYSFAPGQGNIPLSIFMDKYSEELSFPQIFAGKARVDPEERKAKVYYSELCKSELRRNDRRAANCVDDIFFKLKKLQMKTMIGQATIAVRKNKTAGKHLTAGDLRTPGHLEKLVQFDDGYMVLKTLRGSPPYFKKAKSDLFAMIRMLGEATYFCSFSAAETKWKHLLRILGKLQDDEEYTDEEIDNMDWEKKSTLISSDPVTCVRQFDYQVNLLFRDVLKAENSPLGKITDYFYRVEFQHRGSPHIHTLLWVDEAPKYKCSENEEIVEYIDSKISCRRIVDDDDLQPLVNYQTHKHSHTCKRKNRKICRFGFPKPPMPNTVILEPLDATVGENVINSHKSEYDKLKVVLDEMKDGEDISFEDFLGKVSVTYEQYIMAVRSSITSATVFLKRTPNELRVNSYNPLLLKAWRANLDIQFVLDVYACAMYIASYIAKSQRGISDLLRQAMKEVKNGNYGIRDQVKIIGNKFLNNVEISAQEAAYIVLQLPMRKASREVVFINTAPPCERVYLLKSQDQLENLDDEDENIQSSNYLDRYKNRSKQLENVSLADYIAWYDRKNTYIKRSKQVENDQTLVENQMEHNSDWDDEDLREEKSSQAKEITKKCMIKKRAVARVIRYVNFNVDKEPEKHYRELLMLYSNWRDEEIDLLGGFDSFQARYEQMEEKIVEQIRQYDANRDAVDAAILAEGQNLEDAWDQQAPVTQQVEKEDEMEEMLDFKKDSESGKPTKYEYDIGMDLGLPTESNVDQVALYEMPDENYRSLMRSLNEKQLYFVYDTLMEIKRSQNQVFRFLSGGAGVGKSFVTTALYQSLLRYYKTKAGDDFEIIKQILLAPTGKAAYNINGSTLHSALKIPVCQSLQYKSLDSSRLNTLRSSLGGLKVVFIDEISMVGCGMMNFVNKRFQDIKGSPLLFGGCHVICVGDLFQLKPVFDGYIFENLGSAYGPLASNIWKDNFCMYELTEIMRQKDSKAFAELLNRLREGNYISEEEKCNDMNILKSRLLKVNEESEYPFDIQHLFLSNEKMKNFNDKVFGNMVGEKIVILAKDSIVGSASQAVGKAVLEKIPDDPRKTMQLHSTLGLVIGLKCEIALNARLDDGLTNGASCTVKKIQSGASRSASSTIVWVQFENPDVGKLTRKDYKNHFSVEIGALWTPILAVSRQFRVGKYKNAEVMRMQIPLRPAAAKTVHRSQGDTLESVVVDFEGRKTPHIHYVGLSRVKTIEGLHIINLNENKISISNDVKVEMNELRTTRKVVCRTRDLSSVSSDKIIVVYHNVRSLQKYFEDVKVSLCKINASVVILAETRVKASVNSDMYNIPGYTLYRNDACTEKMKNHHGMAVYVNNDMKLEEIVVEPFNMNGIEMNVITLNIEISNIKKSCKILGIYKPPKVSESQFCSTVTDMNKTSDKTDFTIVLGDFNMQFEKCKTSKVGEMFMDMNQLIDEPTTDSDTMIDLIYTDLPKDHTRSGVQENYFSDHKVIYLIISNEKFSNNENDVDNNIPVVCNTQNENMWKPHSVKEIKRDYFVDKKIPSKKISKEIRKTSIQNEMQADDVIIRKYGYRITRRDLATLTPRQWLNDQVINVYMKYLQERERNEGNQILAEEIFCYTRIQGNLRNAVEFYRGRNILQYDMILLPVYTTSHWSLLVIYVRSKTIKYFDSLGSFSRGAICLNTLLSFINEIETVRSNTWKTIMERNITIQDNGYDCGVYVCMFADYILQGLSLKNRKRNAAGYRQHMKEIIMM